MAIIGVIGGGAAGFFAAIHAAQEGAQVTIYEKTGKTLSKVKVSGGGRCNVTHAAYQVSTLVKHYPRGAKFLKKAFGKFQVKDTVEWFESRGVKLKTETDGRMFPVSDSSQTIIDLLRQEADKLGVEVMQKSEVQQVTATDEGFVLTINDSTTMVDKVIVSAGGSPKSKSYDVYKKLGHTIIDPIPSLFTFNTPAAKLKQLPGVAVPNVQVRIEGTKLAYEGPLLITHWGVSGPVVLKLSAFGAKWLHEQDYSTNVHIRWVTGMKEEEIGQALRTYKQLHPKRKVSVHPLFDLPKRLWEHLIESAGIDSSAKWSECVKKQINILEQHIFCYILQMKGKTTFKEEFVTAGGIALNEVNPVNMESRLVPNLFFAGEVLDIDGITGGFNFQAAWTTGYIAGKSTQKL
ncbi:aminoacetone oxidase family FAD-binding enzyme [Echinicola strongylocentroti]|uniref:Aminoacetone oxidase family FAD-binding enzyme n=1 Tax=Echinicola strongylocentroti TaxID=1795355 RepID=A0A2Z4INZ0_9BACT|nr:NAD(P)/FAD-dependent oxidoreductase [Echinicola strongylocentroti]AWW32831.1 aminoacetone oxidase family FAD-binding enzyme [Echinicola strongylocentroti]